MFTTIRKWFSKPDKYADIPLDDVLRNQISNRPINSHVHSGVVVNEWTALNFTNVLACVRAIAETMASLPAPVYQRMANGGKQRLRSHPVYKAFAISPDGDLPAMQWRESGMVHLLVWGNWYNEIETTKGGDLLNLHLIAPNRVTPERTKSGKIQYLVSGSNVPIPADRMLHVGGLGFDGFKGYSPIRLGRETIGLGMATERFGAAWFGNGSRGQGVLTHPQKLSDDARENLRRSIEEVHGGVDNSHKWMIIEEGMTAQQIGVPPEDAQFLGTRLFQLQEICRLYRISPALVGDLSRSTFSNQEQESINFVVHTLRPWCCRIENEINRKLFSPNDQDEVFVEFLLDGLLRGDQATRNAAYAVGRQWGWYSADDVLEMENRNPLPDGQGTIYMVPAGYVNAATLVAPDEPEPTEEPVEPAPQNDPEIEQPVEPPSDQSNDDAVQASLACVQDNVDRMLRREVEAIKNAAKRPKDFLNVVDFFYSGHQPIVRRALAPSLTAFAAVRKSVTQLRNVENELIESGRSEVLDLSGTVSPADLPTAIDEWATRRMKKSEEIVRTLAT